MSTSDESNDDSDSDGPQDDSYKETIQGEPQAPVSAMDVDGDGESDKAAAIFNQLPSGRGRRQMPVVHQPPSNLEPEERMGDEPDPPPPASTSASMHPNDPQAGPSQHNITSIYPHLHPSPSAHSAVTGNNNYIYNHYSHYNSQVIPPYSVQYYYYAMPSTSASVHAPNLNTYYHSNTSVDTRVPKST